jgi:peptidylprolyl isomerase
VGTEKRERQKANRQQRLLEEQRAARVAAVRRNVVRWVIIAVLAIGAVVLLAWIGGAFSDDEEPETTVPPTTTATEDPETTVPPTTAAEDATPPATFETPEKPEVEIPDEPPTELQVTTLIEGEGPEAQVGDTVTVHYVGVLSEDGTEFDNSYDRGTPFDVTLGDGNVIQGWEEGLLGVQAGERVQLDIPADLAYGDTGSPPVIEPGDALTFVIDVLAVTPGADS